MRLAAGEHDGAGRLENAALVDRDAHAVRTGREAVERDTSVALRTRLDAAAGRSHEGDERIGDTVAGAVDDDHLEGATGARFFAATRVEPGSVVRRAARDAVGRRRTVPQAAPVPPGADPGGARRGPRAAVDGIAPGEGITGERVTTAGFHGAAPIGQRATASRVDDEEREPGEQDRQGTRGCDDPSSHLVPSFMNARAYSPANSLAGEAPAIRTMICEGRHSGSPDPLPRRR